MPAATRCAAGWAPTALVGNAGFDFASYLGRDGRDCGRSGQRGEQYGRGGGRYLRFDRRSARRGFNDSLTGDSAANFLQGGPGADSLNGGAGFDYADYFNSTIAINVDLSNAANNTGESAGDTYVSTEGIRGGAFNDTLAGDGAINVLAGGGGADVLNGGAGFDYAAYFNATTGVVADLGTPANNTSEAAGDTYASIEGLIGGNFDDTLTGDAANNFLRGGLGADALDGAAGFDYADHFDATTGVTVDLGNPANNTGEALGDTYVSIEGIRGGAFNDTLTGDAGDNYLRGGFGADVLDGGAGFDVADYMGSGGVTVNLGNPALNTGEAFGDAFLSIEGLRGGDFNDNLTGDGNSNLLEGGAGNDILLLGNGASSFGNDSVDGGAGQIDAIGIGNSASILHGATIDFSTHTVTSVDGTASFTGIESAFGTMLADTFIAIDSSRLPTGLGNSNGLFDYALSLRGYAGNDSFTGDSRAGYFEQVNYSEAPNAVFVNLATGTAFDGYDSDTLTGGLQPYTDTLVNIDAVQGSAFADVLTAGGTGTFTGNGTLFQQLEGMGGNDTLDANGAFNVRVEYLVVARGRGGESGHRHRERRLGRDRHAAWQLPWRARLEFQ